MPSRRRSSPGSSAAGRGGDFGAYAVVVRFRQRLELGPGHSREPGGSGRQAAAPVLPRLPELTTIPSHSNLDDGLEPESEEGEVETNRRASYPAAGTGRNTSVSAHSDRGSPPPEDYERERRRSQAWQRHTIVGAPAAPVSTATPLPQPSRAERQVRSLPRPYARASIAWEHLPVSFPVPIPVGDVSIAQALSILATQTTPAPQATALLRPPATASAFASPSHAASIMSRPASPAHDLVATDLDAQITRGQDVVAFDEGDAGNSTDSTSMGAIAATRHANRQSSPQPPETASPNSPTSPQDGHTRSNLFSVTSEAVSQLTLPVHRFAGAEALNHGAFVPRPPPTLIRARLLVSIALEMESIDSPAAHSPRPLEPSARPSADGEDMLRASGFHPAIAQDVKNVSFIHAVLEVTQHVQDSGNQAVSAKLACDADLRRHEHQSHSSDRFSRALPFKFSRYPAPARDRSARARLRWQQAIRGVIAVYKFGWNSRRMEQQVIVDGAEAIVAVGINTWGWLIVFQDGSINLFHPVQGIIEGTLHLRGLPHGAELQCGAFNQATNRLVVGTTDSLHRYDINFRHDHIQIKLVGSIEISSKPRCITWSGTPEVCSVGYSEGLADVVDPDMMHADYSDAVMFSFRAPHLDEVVAVAVGARSQLLATGCKDKHARVFDIGPQPRGSSRSRLLYSTPRDRVYALAFEPIEEELLLIGADDNVVELVHPRQGLQIFRVTVHTDYVRSVAFTPSGNEFVTASKNGEIFVSDTASGQQTFRLDIDDAQQIQALYMDPRSNFFLAGSFERPATAPTRLTLFNVLDYRRPKRRQTAKFATKPIIDVKFSKLYIDDNTRHTCLLALASCGTIVVMDVDHGLIVMKRKLKQSNPVAIIPHPDERHLLVVDRNGDVSSVDPQANDSHVWLKAGHEGRVLSAILTARGDCLACLYDTQELELIPLESRGKTLALDLPEECTCVVAFTVSGKDAMAFGTKSGNVFMLDLDQSSVRWVEPCHEKEVFNVAASRCNRLLASASRDKTVCIINSTTGEILYNLDGHHHDHIRSVAFNANNDLAAGGADGLISIYCMFAIACFKKPVIKAPVNATTVLGVSKFDTVMLMVKLGRLLVVGSSSGTLSLMDLSLIRQMPMGHEAQMELLADRKQGGLYRTISMVELYPLIVNTRSYHGRSLLHKAVEAEDMTLLRLLLAANIPSLWLALDDHGEDVLSIAARKHSYPAIKMIFQAIITAKHQRRLARLPNLHDHGLRNIIMIAREFPGLVAKFLQDFGLDETLDERGDVLVLHLDFVTEAPDNLIVGSQQRLPPHSWVKMKKAKQIVTQRNSIGSATAEPHRESRAGSRRIHSTLSVKSHELKNAPLFTAAYVGFPEAAGLLIRRPSKSVFQPWHRSDHGDRDDVRESLLHHLLHCRDARLFGNTIMRKVLDFKWNSYARRLFFYELLLFMVYLALFQAFAVLMSELRRDYDQVYTTPRGIAAGALSLLSCIFAGRQAFRERRQIAVAASAALLTVVSTILYLTKYERTHDVVAVCIFLLWMQVLYFLRAFAATGALVRIVFRVLGRSMPFLFLLLLMMVAVTSASYVFFGDEVEPPGDGDTMQFDSSTSYSNAILNSYSIFVLSEMELFFAQLHDASTHNDVLVKLFFLVVSVLITVFMLNLLIGLMSEYMAQVHQEEGDAYPYELATIIAELELSMPQEVVAGNRSFFPRWLHSLVPKNDDHMDDGRGNGGTGAITTDRNSQALAQQIKTMQTQQAEMAANLHKLQQRLEDMASGSGQAVSKRRGSARAINFSRTSSQVWRPDFGYPQGGRGETSPSPLPSHATRRQASPLRHEELARASVSYSLSESVPVNVFPPSPTEARGANQHLSESVV
ncbi:uncharacterized protein MONBRDRAFT_29209 [Monosiga brevicollis MX1]|uniref:Ion transport domain-containing protein n=1 Tax=Monosiga brevicollis TaxID=81824 RepID=A9VAF6_MONBE|nr:uncharacterized protein MONBRDRAFT_29209 [Monosiga brevicollis MX1]EDQ85533.1 predicted protein [Monosiga brevicollis MX1]|eukprot:XP_001749724.1 hypothetical protein [Monosiga brevicollis MX1]